MFFIGSFRDVVVIIGDIRNLQPVRPTAVADWCLDHAYLRSAGMDDLSVSDIDSDMPFVPNGKSGDFRDRIDGSAFFGVCVHGVGTNIRHAVCAVLDLASLGIEPAVAFDQADAVCCSAADPVFFYEVCIAAYLVGILLGFRFIQAPRQYLSVGSPYVAPASGVGVLCPLHEIQIVLGARIDISRRRDIHGADRAHHLRELIDREVSAEG